MQSLRDPAINPNAAHWFGDLSEPEIKAQIVTILEKQNELEQMLSTLSTDLKLPLDIREQFIELFVDRLEYLVTHFVPEARIIVPTNSKSCPKDTAAGVLTWAMVDNLPHVLLSKRARHEWWDNFGGKSDPADTWLHETAAREVAEESASLIIFRPYQLSQMPSHDLVVRTKNGEPFVYRMYVSPHAYIDSARLHEAHKALALKHSPPPEHTDFQWIPVEAIINAVERNELEIVEGHNTVLVSSQRGEMLPLYPPLFKMLRQTAVMDHLHKLANQEPLAATHTRSVLDSPSVDSINMDEKVRKRVITSPAVARIQLNRTLTHFASAVLPELKQKIQPFRQKSEEFEMDITSPEVSNTISQSQSELHLKVLLGDVYREGDLQFNVSKALTGVIAQSAPFLTP